MQSSKNSTVIQWNCRGVRPNYEDLLLLINNLSPTLICLQEIKTKANYSINPKNYTTYQKTTDGVMAHGGVSILVNKNTPHSYLTLNTPLQAVAIRVALNKHTKCSSVCNIYLPPDDPLSLLELERLLQQLPKPVLLLGDFNAHSPLWGDKRLCQRGKLIEQFITNNNLIFLNSGTPTYIHSSTGSLSCIDLSICSPELYTSLNWDTLKDTHGSDHLPITIGLVEPPRCVHGVSRWKLSKADWPRFANLCTVDKLQDDVCSRDDPIGAFSNRIIEIALDTVPKTSSSTKRTPKPWFTGSCKAAVHARKIALAIFKSSPCTSNMISFKKARANARREIRHAKRASWREYVSKLTTKSSSKDVWSMVKKIQGKNTNPIVHLRTDTSEVTCAVDIANCLAETIATNSSNHNYNNTFLKHKIECERIPINFSTNNQEYYNTPFSYEELLSALEQCSDGATGPDDVHYQFLKHLPTRTLKLMLELLNRIWNGEFFPPGWKEAIVVPIPKPGKDPSNPNNYRPIALTSCICKIMEKMVNSRLMYYLESNNIIAKEQSGFRKGRSTTDHLVRLETWIREGIATREHVVAIFFDLEKAYDTTWQYGILKDLYSIGLRGNLPIFVSKFLENRSFKVRIGSVLSKSCALENGVPQGSVLAVTLFGIKVNEIVKCAVSGVDSCLFVDDFCTVSRSKSMRTIERKLQLTLNNLQKWTNQNGFRFSDTKTVCVHFCNQKKVHDEPALYLNGKLIPVKKEHKFLGVMFDSKLSFIPHIKNLKTKCTKALNLLRVVSGESWGADSDTLLMLYRSIVRSKLDFACIVYGSARKSYLEMLNPVQNQALRCCLGAFRTSPADSIRAEAGEPSLDLRREKLSAQYYLTLNGNPNNPASECALNTLHKTLFEQKEYLIPTYGIRMERLYNKIKTDLKVAYKLTIPREPPWMLLKPKVHLDLHQQPKAKANIDYMKLLFLEFHMKHRNYIFLYTDGSKTAAGVGAAAVSKTCIKSIRLPDCASIFTAEAQAILLALKLIDNINAVQFMIATDSLSCIMAIDNMHINNPLILEIIEQVNYLHLCNPKSIEFCWIPSHVGIPGNEKADALAKDALSLTVDPSIHIPSPDIKAQIKQYIKETMQERWNTCINNKLQSIMPTIDKLTPFEVKMPNRRDCIIIHRLRIGHTYITHRHLLHGQDEPICETCQVALTVRHILIECPVYAAQRNQLENTNTLHDLFNSNSHSKVISFIKNTNFYSFI